VVPKDQAFTLTTDDGKPVPVQSWPLAYWPDGSLKWSGFATVAGLEITPALKLSRGKADAPPGVVVRVQETGEAIEIDTGKLTCRIPRQGAFLINSMIIDGREVARAGRLVCTLEDRSEIETNRTSRLEDFVSQVNQVTVEQSGPVRAVVKFEGRHKAVKGGREWLPFHVRLYFYAGQESVRMVHTIVFDGDEQKDFIRGLGVVFDVPLREQVQNRHVRFSGENGGLWAEPIQPMIGRGGRFVAGPSGRDVYPDQIAGKRVPNQQQVNTRGQNLLSKWAVWDDFRLIQPNADGFTIEKRTNPQSAWLPAGAGKRASGLVFVGDVTGGLGVAVRNFWQSYPVSLEIRKAGSEVAELRAWLWSPDAPAMDLRHYDTVAHGLEEVYEDVQPGFSTPNGIARTSELTLYPSAAVPVKEDTVKQAQANAQPPLLVCTPQYLHAVQAFGIWSVEDRSTPLKRAIEERLDATVHYYLQQVDQRNWYGFWDFGDVMHSYDNERHVWRYDLGGMAWDNSELGTDMWLWYMFLHTGRADIFRMAEAMTRHTGEVDSYHQGRFAGLGSRHNVRHWGCGAKEARISQAAYRRFHYYLTTDERTGDVMREMVNADFKAAEYDPMRLAQPATEAEKKYPGRVRLGPDWLAFLGNWMTEWERTGDTKWRDKIYAGMDCLCQMPLGLRTGRNLLFGYEPTTGKLYQLSEDAGSYNLATIMGGAEVVFELNLMVDHEGWQKAWLQYCRLVNAPKNVIVQDMTTGIEGNDATYVRDGRLAAYVYWRTKNPAFVQAGLNALIGSSRGGRGGTTVRKVEGPQSLNPVDEAGMAGTNGAAQNGLTTLELLAMIGDQLPTEASPGAAGDGTGGMRGRGGRSGTRGSQPPPGNPKTTNE
jgi:hypothetical protein